MDLAAATMRVQSAKHRDAQGNRRPLVTVTMDPELVAALRAHQLRQKVARMAARTWADPDLVWATRRGTAYSGRNVLRWYHNLPAVDGGHDLHTLRTTYITTALAAPDASPADVAANVSDSVTTIMRSYAKARAAGQVAAARHVAAAILGG